MLSVVIPTLDAAAELEETFAALAPARAQGLVDEVVVADGGSRDETAMVAARLGGRVVRAPRGRGSQLAAGARAAAGQWLLFLHADTVLAPEWIEAAGVFMHRPDAHERAAVFRFAVDDSGPAARRMEALVAWRCRVLALPYGDQGLLISRRLYDQIGGFRTLPLMEDVDIVRRLGSRRLVVLEPAAITAARRYREAGYLTRSLRNLVCLGLYFLGVPPRLIARLYG